MVRKPECSQVSAALLNEETGQPLSAEEDQLVQEHIATCEDCFIERNVLEILGDSGAPGPIAELDDLSRRRLADNILVGFQTSSASKRLTSSASHAIWRTKVIRVAIAAVALCVVVIGALYFARAPDNTSEVHAVAEKGPEIALSWHGGLFAKVSEGVQCDNRDVSIDTRILQGSRIETGSGTAVLAMNHGFSLSLAAGTILESTTDNDGKVDMFLHEGELFVSVLPDQSNSEVSISTRLGQVRVTGTLFSVSVIGENVEVRMFAGEVDIIRNQKPPARLATGQGVSFNEEVKWGLSEKERDRLGNRFIEMIELGLPLGHREMVFAETIPTNDGDTGLVETSTDSDPSNHAKQLLNDSKPAISKLLNSVREHKSNREWTDLSKAYQDLIDHFPNTGRAKTALVALGQLKLDRLGQPKSALANFEGYLINAPHGPLALEALLGKAECLKRLGLKTRERNTLEMFESRFPNALQITKVRKRLEQL